MIRNRARLFDNYESYKRSLPVRKTAFEGDEPWKLVDLPYFASEEDLRVMTEQLESIHPEKRCTPVKYVVSPTCTGKTASICPAFLNSATGRSKTKYSHYLYLAFENNPGRDFYVENKEDISERAEVAEAQGEAFMFECLRHLFDLKFGVFGCYLRIPTEQDLQDQGGLDIFSRTEEWAQLFDSNMEPGRILIHVDEHKMMSKNPDFRRGALSAIGGNLGSERASLVATYTEVPTEVPGLKSSRACRYAVPVPALAVNAALRYAGCPDVPEGLDSSDRRFLASFKFRLAAHLCNKMTLFHAYTCPDLAVGSMVTDDLETILGVYRRCIENAQNSMKATGPYCEFVKILSDQEDGPESFMDLTRKPRRNKQVDHVIDLFLGVSEFVFDKLQENKRVEVHHLVSFACGPDLVDDDPLLTLSLKELLSKDPRLSDKGYKVYTDARDMFLDTLRTLKVEDLLSGRPLDRAYLWALSTRAARKDSIRLGKLRLPFKCKHVTNGRIFKNMNAFDGGALDWSLTDIGWMEPGTIYYAQERADGETTHPLCDIFFLTDENDLVLLDITGSGKERGAETQKKKKWSKCFIDAWRRDGPAGQGLVVAILCPLGDGVTRASKDYPELKYIYGRDAREMLGGLVQFLAWY